MTKKYNATFVRDFEVQIEAEDIWAAEKLAKAIVKNFPPDTCKLESIFVDGYVEPPQEPKTSPKKPSGNPNGGGTPGTPVIKKEILVDQVAKVA